MRPVLRPGPEYPFSFILWPCYFSMPVLLARMLRALLTKKFHLGSFPLARWLCSYCSEVVLPNLSSGFPRSASLVRIGGSSGWQTEIEVMAQVTIVPKAYWLYVVLALLSFCLVFLSPNTSRNCGFLSARWHSWHYFQVCCVTLFKSALDRNLDPQEASLPLGIFLAVCLVTTSAIESSSLASGFFSVWIKT